MMEVRLARRCDKLFKINDFRYKWRIRIVELINKNLKKPKFGLVAPTISTPSTNRGTWNSVLLKDELILKDLLAVVVFLRWYDNGQCR